MTVPCNICGTDISKFFGKNPMGICESCHKVYCPKCAKELKKDECPSCHRKVFLTKSIMKQLPANWSQPPQSPQSPQNVVISVSPVAQSQKFCNRCGKPNPSDAAFCNGCGTRM